MGGTDQIWLATCDHKFADFDIALAASRVPAASSPVRCPYTTVCVKLLIAKSKEIMCLDKANVITAFA